MVRSTDLITCVFNKEIESLHVHTQRKAMAGRLGDRWKPRKKAGTQRSLLTSCGGNIQPAARTPPLGRMRKVEQPQVIPKRPRVLLPEVVARRCLEAGSGSR